MKYSIEKLADNSWRIYSPLGVYMDLIVGMEKALLWDTGYGFGDLKKTVREITDLPLYIVNSHGHCDHACGNAQFEETVFIHPADMELCAKHTGRLQRVIAAEYARSVLSETDLKNDFSECDLEEYYDKGSGKLTPVEGGNVFDLGGVHLKVVELPGHTKGSIGLLNEEEGILYVGDAVNESFWLFLPEATNITTYRNTIRKIIAMNPKQLVLSHRKGFTDPAELFDYLALAEEPDYERGLPFSAPLVPGATARICYRKGYNQNDVGQSGFASIVINKDHM